MVWNHHIKVFIGGLFVIAGVAGVPLAVIEDSLWKMLVFTLSLFIGIAILGKMYKD